jgi:hypothetical protein
MEHSPPPQPVEQKKISEHLEPTLSEIENSIKLPEEEMKAFVNKRAEELESSAQKKFELSVLPGGNFHKGYISKETGVRRNMMFDPLYLDDPALLETFVSSYKRVRDTPGWEAQPPRQVLLNAVQFALQTYFGNARSVGVEKSNADFYVHSNHGEDHISIADFKGKSMAVCAEKASAAQNMLSFAGMDDTYAILSGDCKLSGEDEGGAHIFNVFNSGNGYRIYDPTNPHLQTNEKGEVVSVYPAVYAITDAQFKELTSGGHVEVEHTDKHMDNTGASKDITTKRVYGGVTPQ